MIPQEAVQHKQHAGAICEVLVPLELRRQIARAAQKMAEFYADEEIPPNRRG
jgi:hypothetical protein